MEDKNNTINISNFASDIETYLSSKLPDIPECTKLEIAAYVGHKATYLVVDSMNSVIRDTKSAKVRKHEPR